MVGQKIPKRVTHLTWNVPPVVYVSVRQTVGRDPKWGRLNILWGRFITGILHLKFLS